MANFVLVHGGWDGGWIWRKVARLLRADGHEVYTPTLTGMGERSHLRAATVSLDTHIQDVLNVIAWESLDEVVLCGHSYAGMVVAGVADAIPDKLRALVYLDAIIPADGQAALDMVNPPWPAGMFQRAAGAGGDMVPRPTTSSLPDAADRAWVLDKMTAQPLASFVQAIRLTGAADRVRRKISIYTDGFGLAGRFLEEYRAKPGWETHLLKGCHNIHVEDPQSVAVLLADAAA
jgi:pimeloyl-ACP methyl ester carboxylesterase